LPVDLLPLSYVAAPLIIVVGALLLPGALLPMARPWARYAVAGFVAVVVLRYLDWRIGTTVLAAEGAWYELAWIWFCLGVELLGLFDAGILYLVFLRVTDRRAEADAGEVRLRAAPPDRLPSVDVFIATYNEPLDVLEKSIVGALMLDYPNFRVWVLDDGRRAWLHDFCRRKGVGYITRPDNRGAKAGNINHALRQTEADFVMVLDADFIPQRNFLIRTIGFFDDPRVGIVQVPHAFYNQDPMQTNLSVGKVLPDDQRFFFEAIMPSRDGWDAAFCCGSNSITRRSAIRRVGDALPTG
jgi:cellulose synthase (UDP-forming)